MSRNNTVMPTESMRAKAVITMSMVLLLFLSFVDIVNFLQRYEK